MAKKPKPTKVTQKHIDNAQEIAQILSSLKGSQGPEQEEPQPTPPSGVSPLGGLAK